MENSIKNIIREAIFHAKCEANSVNRNMTLSDVKLEISCIIETITFDTVVSKNMFLSFLETELRKVAANLYPADMQMDKNGKYTNNSKKWA